MPGQKRMAMGVPMMVHSVYSMVGWWCVLIRCWMKPVAASRPMIRYIVVSVVRIVSVVFMVVPCFSGFRRIGCG